MPDKELKTLGIKVLAELGEKIDLNTDHFHRESENINTQLKINLRFKITHTDTHTLEGMNSRLSDTEDQISDLENRKMGII